MDALRVAPHKTDLVETLRRRAIDTGTATPLTIYSFLLFVGGEWRVSIKQVQRRWLDFSLDIPGCVPRLILQLLVSRPHYAKHLHAPLGSCVHCQISDERTHHDNAARTTALCAMCTFVAPGRYRWIHTAAAG